MRILDTQHIDNEVAKVAPSPSLCLTRSFKNPFLQLIVIQLVVHLHFLRLGLIHTLLLLLASVVRSASIGLVRLAARLGCLTCARLRRLKAEGLVNACGTRMSRSAYEVL